MVNLGDVATVDFTSTLGIKRRPVVVVSTPAYQATRPDVVLDLLTAQTEARPGRRTI